MASDTATAESWRTYNLQLIEDLKKKAQEPGISWIVKMFWTWLANKAIKKRNDKAFSRIGAASVRAVESGNSKGKRLVILERNLDGRKEVIFEPTMSYPKLGREGRDIKAQQ